MNVPFLDRLLGSRQKRPEDHTVAGVDLSRFAGKWFEIAAFPAWFEKGCRCSTAEYVDMDDYVEITNTCVKNGEIKTATGRAHPVDGTNNAQLKVRFVWPFESDYWIVALDDDYQHAMVGHPEKKYLWILSRSPQMDDSVYESLVTKALALGYDTQKLKKTDQSCSTGW